MKKILSLFVVFSLSIGYIFAQNQINPMELPNLTQRVTDFSNTLTTSQLDDINTTAKSYEDETSNQVFVVLFPQRQGNELIDIGTKVFNENDIGQKDKNNGLLLLISTEEKKIRIIVGYGLESIYPDLVASQIIENDIRPLVNK
ncbi:MAG: TPM domain-containing protein [bacterium]